MTESKKPERMHTCATCAITRVVGGEPIAVPARIKILAPIRLRVAEHPVDAHDAPPAGEP